MGFNSGFKGLIIARVFACCIRRVCIVAEKNDELRRVRPPVSLSLYSRVSALPLLDAVT